MSSVTALTKAGSTLVLAAGAMALVGGCAGPTTNPEKTLADARAGLPEHFARQADATKAPRSLPTRAVETKDWPMAYGDAQLDAVVAAVLSVNRDLAVARARLGEARAGAVQVASALWPTIDLDGFGARARQLRNTPTPNRIVDAGGVDLQASWEADLFHGNADRKRATQLDAEAAQANVQGVTVALVAETTASYLELAGADTRLAVLDRNIAVQAEGLRLANAAFRAGLAIDLTVRRATARLASTQALRPPLEQARAALVHRLAVLAGATPERFIAQFEGPVALPTTLPADPDLVPSDLLARRPDLRAAQAQLQAAAARAHAARTNLLPKFFLSAFKGQETLSVAQLATFRDPVYFIGASVALPLFNAGRIRAQIAAEDFRLEAAAAAYEQALFRALEDVENAYAGVAAAQTARARLVEAAEAAAAAEARARSGFELGRVDYATLLDTERERLAAEDGEVQARTAAAVAYASLFRAFGGGWDLSRDSEWSKP